MSYHRPAAAGHAKTPLQVVIELILSQHGIPASKGPLHLVLESRTFEPLIIERLRVYDCDTNGLCWSISQQYTQNGDVMRDPEMVLDGQTWEPLYFRNDGLNLEQYVYPSHPNHRGGKRTQLSDSLTSFAREWAKTLHAQGFDDVHNFIEPGLRHSDSHRLKDIWQRPNDSRLLWPDGSRWG